MRDFHMSEQQAMRYPLARAHALCVFNALRNPWCPMEIDGDGYVAQERHRIAARNKGSKL